MTEEKDEMIIDTSKMSEGKRAALELAEGSRDKLLTRSTLAGSLFMGNLLWEDIYPWPEQAAEDVSAGDAFLAKLNDFLQKHTDPDEIDRTGEVPDEVIEGLAKLGAFGIKIKTDYQGLGLSQINYCRAAIKLGSHCGNLTALISAHQSIGVPQPLIMFGTDEQKSKYLPRLAGGEISAFALTESGVGSDPAKMTTEALPSEEGDHFILNGEKLWCTNGVKANLLVVMAKTPRFVRGKERNQITAFIVEADSPGVTIVRRCHFMGLKALYNAVITFENVKVPKENIILKEGKGLKVALATLNTGRLTLPAACSGAGKRCLEICRNWANEREQWGSPIGHHAAIADKISKIAASVFATDAMTFYTAGLVDRKQGDIRLEAAMCKMYGTEAAWRNVDETLQIRGGRGYETAESLAARGEKPIAVERMLRDCRINTIFEGSSEIMRLFIAREALDPHLKVASEALNSRNSTGQRLAAAAKAFGFYARWYPKQWLPAFVFTNGMDPRLAKHVHYTARCSKRLARKFFHAMAKHGPKLEREQVLLGNFVDIGTMLFAIAASCSRAQSLGDQESIELADYFCREARLDIAAAFRGDREK